MHDNARPKMWSLVATAAAAIVMLSGCSSSGSKGGSAGGSNPASGSAVANVDSTAAAQTAAAKRAVAPFLLKPTKIHQTVPLTGKIPTDKPWVIITCELPQCQILSGGALAAAKAAGVPTKLLSYKTTDATTLTTAMKDALNDNPIAVSPIGFSQSAWDNLQPQYKAKGVIITSIALGDNKESDVVTTGSGSQLDYTAGGTAMANYVIANSNAAAHVLVMDVPAFAVLKAYGDGFKAQIAKGCSACKVSKLDLAPTQLAGGGVVPAVVAALQKDKSIKWLVATDGAFLAGITPALKAAGLKDIKIVGGSPDINNLNALKSGDQTAWTGAAESQYGWVALDIIARKHLGMSIPPGDGGRITQILTKDNVGTPDPSGLGAPADYQQQYKKLWGIS